MNLFFTVTLRHMLLGRLRQVLVEGLDGGRLGDEALHDDVQQLEEHGGG